MIGDPLEWLLPEAPAEERAGLVRVVQALRLLRTDLERPGTRSVAPSWSRAHGELEQRARVEAVRALEVLLHAHLEALRPADSFLPLAPVTGTLADAWRLLLGRGLAVPAQPGAAAGASARMLIARGTALGTPEVWGEYWQAALEHVERGPEPGRWQRAFARARARRARPAVLARFAGGWVASLLERGAPARARTLLDAHAPLCALDPALARLARWSALVLGEPAAPDPLAHEPLPRALAELAREPGFGVLLAGSARTGAVRAFRSLPTRVELGASVRALFAAERGGGARLVRVEGPACARGGGQAPLRAAPVLAAFAAGAPRRAGLAPGAQGPLAGALDGRSRALVVVPFRAAGGGWQAWQFEWPHALAPCLERFALLARRLEDGERAPSGRAVVDGPFERELGALAQELGALGIRHWAAFEPGSPARLRRARGLELWLSELGQDVAGVARRAGFAHQELRAGARVLLELVVAAEPALVAALAERVPLWAERLLAAHFRAAECARLGREPCWGPEARPALALRALSPTGPWRVVGPPGSGRHTVARALLHRAGFAPDEVERVREGAPTTALAAGTLWIGAEAVGVDVVRVPPLAERRDELAGILRHCARGARPGPLLLDDEALACLWRQDWLGGWSELQDVCADLARRGTRLDREAVRAALRARGWTPVERRRDVGAEELVALLRATAHRGGNHNLARAARWLGWAPETLARRRRALEPASRK